MKTQIIPKTQHFLLNPISLFTQELKNKQIKKQSIENIQTIALVLTSTQVRSELVPILIKTFAQQNNQIRVTIIKSFPKLLEFIGGPNGACVLLEFVIDILCVFSEEQIRKEADNTLKILMDFINAKNMKDQLLKVIKQLQKQTDLNMLETNLKLILYVYPVADEKEQQQLLELISQYQEKPENLVTIAEQLPKFINKIPNFPEQHVHSMITSILNSTNSKAKTKLIEAITLFTHCSNQTNTLNIYVLTLLKDSNSDVVASVIMHIKQLVVRFDKLVLNQIWEVIDSFESRDNTIKTAIIEVLEYIPLTEERKQMIISSNNPNKSLNLSKTLATALCKIHDFNSLETIINNSDTQFKNKLFPKLPATCEIHIKLMEQLLGQKNWRNKLTLIQNIEKRLESNQNVEILLPKLLQQLGDKIAVVRVGVIKLIYLIIRKKKQPLTQIKNDLNISISSKNWFQRQSVYMLVKQMGKHYSELNRKDQELIKQIAKKGTTDSVNNNRQLANEILAKID